MMLHLSASKSQSISFSIVPHNFESGDDDGYSDNFVQSLGLRKTLLIKSDWI